MVGFYYDSDAGAQTLIEAFSQRLEPGTDLVTNCNDSGPGSFRQAATGANPGDIVSFALSPSCSLITLTSGPIEITANNLTIDGPGASSLAISGNGAARVFHVGNGVSATIAGLTIEDGNDHGDVMGGGIYNSGTLTVTNSSISDNGNSGGITGGGIYNSGTLTVTNSSISDNDGEGNDAFPGAGGGIYNSGGTVSVSDSTISDNQVGGNFNGGGSGGGVENSAGTLTVTNSTISRNFGGSSGGGIFTWGSGTMAVTDSTISGNSVSNFNDPYGYANGGGISGAGTITGSTISGNEAVGSNGSSGGGISGGVTITDSTISGNSATSDGNAVPTGGGIIGGTITNSTISGNKAVSYYENDPPVYGAEIVGATLAATIVANPGNGVDCGGITDGGYNLADDTSCGFSGTSLSDTPAGLDPTGLQNNGGPTQTIALEPGSAAIGAVTNASLCSGTDQRGVPRPTPCDIGAYQTQVPQTITFTSPKPTNAVVGGPTYTPVATGGASGNPVVITVDATSSAVCLISSGVVSFISFGTCTLDANQAGDATYLAAPQVQQSFTVAAAIKMYLPGNLWVIHGLPVPVAFSVLGAKLLPIPSSLASAADILVSFNNGPSVRATYVALAKTFVALISTSRSLAPGTYPLVITSNTSSVPLNPTTVMVKIIG
jgi:hypothetical protein